VEIDHVLFAVDDLPAAAQAMEAGHGLSSIEGGRHPGWGTANRIVPLGDAYLELVAIVDQTEAAQSLFGSWVASAAGTLGGPFGWAVRTPRLDDVAHRLGLTVSAGSRLDRSGRPLRWRLAGVEQAADEPSLPFFIEWEAGTPLPGRAPRADPVGALKIVSLRLTGDADRLAAWLGCRDMPITVRSGAPAVTGITLAGSAGEIVLGDAPD
jgi:hypothetical protein